MCERARDRNPRALGLKGRSPVLFYSLLDALDSDACHSEIGND